MHSSAGSALEQIVDYRDDKKFVFFLDEVDDALVGVHHVFQVGHLVGNEGEAMVVVVLLIEFAHHFELYVKVEISVAQDSSREAAAHRDKVHVGAEALLQLPQRLLHFGKVLMLERLVDAHVVVTPRIVGGSARLNASASAAGDGVDVDCVVEHQVLCQRQQCELHSGGEAARVGYMIGLVHDASAVEFRQTIHEVVSAVFDAEVGREVDDAEFFGHGVCLEERAGVAVRSAAEEHVDALKVELVGEIHAEFTYKPLMHRSDGVASVAGAVYPNKFNVGVVDKQADKFSGCVSSTANNTGFYHDKLRLDVVFFLRVASVVGSQSGA